MSPDDSAWLERFANQLDNVLTEIRQIRQDNTAQFAALENKYVLQQVYSATLANLHSRQDVYQGQTDHLILGVEEEMQKLHHEIADVEDRRVVALEKVATQRHNDHIAIGLGCLAAVVAVVVALIPVWSQ